MAVPGGFFGTTDSSSSAGPGGFFSGGGGGGSTIGSWGVSLSGSAPLSEAEEEAKRKATQRKLELGAVARLKRGNDNDKRMADKFLEDNQHLYTDDELAEYGLEKPGHDDRSLWEKAKGSAMGAIQATMGVVSRPQQFIAHSLNTVGTGLAGGVEVARGNVSAGDWIGGMKEMTEDTFGSIGDIKGENDINTREMLNLDKDAGGSGWFGDYVVGGLDMAGQIATDPLSWMGAAGTSTAAAAGMKTVEKAAAEGLVRAELPSLLRTEGRKAITEAEERVLRDMALETAKDAGAGQRGRLMSRFGEEKTGGLIRQWKEGALADVARGTADESGRLNARYWMPTGTGKAGAERVAENNINALLAQSQKGLRFGGATVLPSAKLRAPLEARGLINSRPLVDNPALDAARIAREEVGAADEATARRIAEAEESKTAWSSKSSEALPSAVARKDEATMRYKTLAQQLNDADPEVYVPPGKAPNPAKAKANQDYLRHEARLKQLDAEMAKLDEADLAVEEQRTALEKQLADVKNRRQMAAELIADQSSAEGRALRRHVMDTDSAAKWDEQINELERQLDALDDEDVYADKLADLNEEYERVAREQDIAATEPDEIYVEGDLAPNPELNTRAKMDVEDTNVYETGEGIMPGAKSITARDADGKGLGTVDYYVDENGVVQIDAINVLDKGKGTGKRLIAKVEEATGQPAAKFGPGDGVEEGAEGFWKRLTGQDVDPETRQPIVRGDEAPKPVGPEKRKSLAAQTQEAEREMQRAEREVARLEKKVGVTAEKVTARAEKKLARLTARRDELAARAASLDERIPKMPGQVEDFIPSRIPGATKAQTVVRRAFQTGSRVADEHGARAAQALKNLRELALGTAESRSTEGVRMLKNVLHAAAGEDRKFLDELPDIYRALETGDLDTVAALYKAQGRTKAANAVETFSRMSAEDTKALVDEGFLPEEHLSTTGGSGGYAHRVETKKAAKARRDAEAGTRRGSPAHPASLFKADAAMGATKARTSHVGEVLTPELQEAMAAERGLPAGTKVIEDNPALSIGEHRAQLEHARAGRDFIKGAEELTDDAGLPLVTRDEALAKTHNYVKVSTPEGTVYAPDAIAEEISRFQDVVYNDETIKAFGRTMDRTMQIWKAHATVPLIGAAFHMRNAETNVLLNWIAGVENPVVYARAAKMQKRLEGAMSKLGTEHASLDEALAASKLTPKEQKIIKLAQEHNVLTSSQANVDLADVGGTAYRDQLSAKGAEPGLRGRAKRAPEKLNFLSPEHFVGTTSGRAIASGFENNARLAHFMWALDKYGDAEIAAQSVKKYLFNYADLTPFERRVMKRAIPFYTFMRKNAALMVTSTAENPGKLSRFGMFQRELEDNTQTGPGFLKDQLVPNYVTEMGQAPVKAPGFGGLTASIETPWSAAADTLAPVGEIAGMVPVANRFVPDEFKGKGPEETALKLLNIPGGPVAESLKYLTERALGKDTFTGAPVKTMNPLGEGLRIMDIFAPSPSKVTRMSDKLTQGDILGTHKDPVQGDERTRRRAAAVINAIFGLNTNAVGPEATEAEVTRRFYELKDYLDVRNKHLEPGDKGYIPTIEELREAGILPSGRKSSGWSTGGSGIGSW